MFIQFLFGLSIVCLTRGVFLPDYVVQPVKTDNKKPLVQPSPSFEQYFDQKLDHFNENDLRSWEQVCTESNVV